MPSPDITIVAESPSLHASLAERRTIDHAEALAANAAGGNVRTVSMPWMPKDFAIKTLSSGAITVTNCRYMSGPVAKFFDDEPTVALTGTHMWVAALMNYEDGTITLEAKENRDEAFEEELQTDAEAMRIPLYELKRETVSDGWAVADDLRWMFKLNLYGK